METQSEQAIQKLFDVYSRTFDQSDSEAQSLRISEGYAGTDFEPTKLDASQFETWLLREWRTPLLKASWLNTFLTADAAVLNLIPANLRKRIIAEMVVESPYRHAS